MSRHEYDDDTIDHGPIGDDDFIERVVDSVCRSVNLAIIDEQGVAAAVGMTFAVLHVGGYHIVKATPR